MKIHYKIFKMLKELLRKDGHELLVKDLQQLILRYILNKIADIKLIRTNDEEVYVLGNSELANKQLLLDIRYYKLDNNKKIFKLIKELLEEAFINANYILEMNLNENLLADDNEIIIEKSSGHILLTYTSNALDKITDNNIKIYDKKIIIDYLSKNKELLNNTKQFKYMFCSLLRYKYLYIDAHGSQLEYKESIENFACLKLNEATECFASPFNHTFKYYCSAFEDLEIQLGSLGNFFKLKKFPTKILLINPVFDIIFIKKVIEHILELLSNKKNKHIVYFILPIWNIISYKSLYESEFFKKKKEFPKGEIFFYNFPTGRRYSPCSIEIIELKN